jgi:hypothetical protein
MATTAVGLQKCYTWRLGSFLSRLVCDRVRGD